MRLTDSVCVRVYLLVLYLSLYIYLACVLQNGLAIRKAAPLHKHHTTARVLFAYNNTFLVSIHSIMDSTYWLCARARYFNICKHNLHDS